MASDVTINTAVNQQQRTAASQGKLADDFSEFLTLLTTQLQNQDPLSPMDTTEFTNQLVLFSGVEQQINSNQKLDDLISLQLNNAFSSTLNYVGMDVSYISAEANYDGETPVKINYALDEQARTSQIVIRDEGGKTIFTADASKDVGSHEFIWDGSQDGGGFAPAGTYSINVDALNADDEFIQNTTVVSGRVRGVETQNGQMFVLVGERAVAVSNILNASTPDPEPDAEQPETNGGTDA